MFKIISFFFFNSTFFYLQNYQRNLTSRSTFVEDFAVLGPADALALDQYQDQPLQQIQTQEPIVAGKRGRKRKLPQLDVNIPVGEASVIRDAATEGDASLDLLQQDSLIKPNDTLMPPPATPGHISASHPLLSPDHSAASVPIEGDIPLAFTPSHMPSGLLPEGMTPLNLVHGGMTPVGLHGDFSAFPPLDQIESIPNLPVDQVSSILNGAGMDSFANMGYDDHHMAGASERIANDWSDDYDFPPSVGAHVRNLFLNHIFRVF